MRLRRPRLTVGAMMALVLVFAGLLGWIAHRARVQREAVAAITTPRRGLQGRVYYDWQFVADPGAKVAAPRGPKWQRSLLGPGGKDPRPRGPKWFRNALGPDVFDTVVVVDIEGDNVDDELLANVAKLRGVEVVSVHGRAAPDLTAAGMAQLGALSRLKGLSVQGFPESRGFVAGLKGKTGLCRVWLPEAAVTDDDMAILGGLVGLEALKLDGSRVTDRGFAHVANLKALSLLEMPGVRISDLAPVADLTQLDVLFLAPAGGTPAPPGPGGPASLGPLRRLTILTQFTLGDTRIEDRDLAVVAGLPRLNSLTLGGRGITEAGLARLAESRSLLFLALADTSIADLRPLSPRLPALLGLAIQNSHLTDAGVEPLSRGIRLADLNLAGSRLTDAGLDTLGSMTGLERLRLDRSAITDAGLARLKSLRALVTLSLTETRLTDASVATLAGFPALRDLNLERSGISPAGVESLRNALPKARISFAPKPE